MKLFYVNGGGLGHLNRFLSYIYYKEYNYEECVVITNSRYINYLPKAIKILQYERAIFKDSEAFFTILTQLLDTYSIEEFVVDVFPAGLYGELYNIDVLAVKKTLLARIIKPTYFFRNKIIPKYDTIFQFEEGVSLESYNYDNVVPIKIEKRLFTCSNTQAYRLQTSSPFFLIMHSAPEKELLNLYSMALTHREKNEHIYIQTFCTSLKSKINDEHVTVIENEKPILELIEKSDKIFTGCGFNTFWSLEKYRDKHFILPFHRLYDDQKKRKEMFVNV